MNLNFCMKCMVNEENIIYKNWARGIRDKYVEHRDFEDSKNTLCDIIMMNTYHYAFVQTHWNIQNQEPYVKYGFWVMMLLYPWWKKFTILWMILLIGESICIWEERVSIPSSWSDCKVKTALKKSLFKQNI